MGTLGGHPGPKTASDSKNDVFGPLLAPSEGTLLEAFSAHVAIQRRPEVENLGFWGDLVAEFLLKRFCVTFGRVLGSENVDFAWDGSKNSNCTEVRILSLFGSMLSVILERKSL